MLRYIMATIFFKWTLFPFVLKKQRTISAEIVILVVHSNLFSRTGENGADEIFFCYTGDRKKWREMKRQYMYILISEERVKLYRSER